MDDQVIELFAAGLYHLHGKKKLSVYSWRDSDPTLCIERELICRYISDYCCIFRRHYHYTDKVVLVFNGF